MMILILKIDSQITLKKIIDYKIFSFYSFPHIKITLRFIKEI